MYEFALANIYNMYVFLDSLFASLQQKDQKIGRKEMKIFSAGDSIIVHMSTMKVMNVNVIGCEMYISACCLLSTDKQRVRDCQLVVGLNIGSSKNIYYYNDAVDSHSRYGSYQLVLHYK